MADTGRPKIQLSDFPKGWQKELIELGRVGASDVEMRGFLNCICHETWTRLIKEEPEFSETIKIASNACQVWWEKNGRLNLHDKDFSATLWYMNMKNRFGWADKREVDVTSKGDSVTMPMHTFIETDDE